MNKQQVHGLGCDSTTIRPANFGLCIDFPTHYTDADRVAIWIAVQAVQEARGLARRAE